MSATNRGSERELEDTYLTHPWCVERLFDVYKIPEGASVLDPCAAGGELLSEIKRLRPDLKLYAIEIKPHEEPKLAALQAAGVIEGYVIGDFLEFVKSVEPGTQFDYVITNPPYSLAREIIEATFAVVEKASIQLLRINFLGAQKRYEFTTATRPGLKILPNRPGFTGWGSDATEYAWFIYGDELASGTWEMCPLTPDAVIEAANEAARARYPHLNPKLVRERKAAKKAAQAATV